MLDVAKGEGVEVGGWRAVRGSGGRGDNSSAKMSSFLSRDPLSWALVAMGEKGRTLPGEDRVHPVSGMADDVSPPRLKEAGTRTAISQLSMYFFLL